jgi:hypothetical protein
VAGFLRAAWFWRTFAEGPPWLYLGALPSRLGSLCCAAPPGRRSAAAHVRSAAARLEGSWNWHNGEEATESTKWQVAAVLGHQRAGPSGPVGASS